MRQLWKENGILEGWKFHDILGNACAPKQRFTKAVSHISLCGHAHLAVLPAAPSCREPQALQWHSWACHTGSCTRGLRGCHSPGVWLHATLIHSLDVLL